MSRGSFEMFKITPYKFGTVGMRSRMRACADEYLAMVNESVVQGVCKVVTRSSFGVTQLHKASGGKWMFHHCVTRSHMNLEW